MRFLDITIETLSQHQNFASKQFEGLDWGGSQMLAQKINKQNLLASEHILLLIDDNTSRPQLIGHGALLQEDIVKGLNLSPFIAAIYVHPDYRGQGYSLKITDHLMTIAHLEGYNRAYIVTKHKGLYEKLAFKQIDLVTNIKGETMRLLTRSIIHLEDDKSDNEVNSAKD
ncbi:GNAT family N-acetyltransferase [Aerococcus kribbianus]|uniref:GNAT family N-acetyltransferase n=1 Tax=Aerococcus kribbianus TaxID=2999064 RepID=A0A9X3FMQ0_9LACT|nr:MULTISPECIES: GNAT family N-acetyltransferase [unclassified Aerococcus]MCZ0717235.1 GNAT family N-acetyltransferase [Aerococcus sp. YH-aer221]MCZ0725523.1 GNAT family N-acetyltransferase [Aerococcus sp. YH-aer222]